MPWMASARMDCSSKGRVIFQIVKKTCNLVAIFNSFVSCHWSLSALLENIIKPGVFGSFQGYRKRLLARHWLMRQRDSWKLIISQAEMETVPIKEPFKNYLKFDLWNEERKLKKTTSLLELRRMRICDLKN